MPNWVEQDLHVVGSKTDVDAFIRAGYRARSKEQFDDLLDLHRLCPLKRGEPKTTYTHDSAVVLEHHRTKTQVHFSMITSWDYPAEFYARLADHWPSLGFVCSVKEDMGSFGGILMVLNGEVTNLVEDYGHAGYSRREQRRRIKGALSTWEEFLTSGRDWRLSAPELRTRTSIRTDAHVDDHFWFYFRSRDEMADFRAKYGGVSPRRHVAGEWKRTR